MVCPALQMRPASSEEHRHHPSVIEEAAEKRRLERELHDAWVAYKSIVEPIEEDRFLSLLAVPFQEIGDQPGDTLLVEAQWVSAEPDGGPSYLPLPSPVTNSVLFRGTQSWVFLRDSRRFARVAPDVGPIALARLVEQPTILLGHEETAKLPALLTEHFLREGIAVPTRESLGLEPLPKPRIVLRVGGSVFAAEAHLQARYQDRQVDLSPESYAEAWDDTRDAEAERAAIDNLASTSLRLDTPSGRRRKKVTAQEASPPTYRAEGERAIQFWTRELPEIVARAGHGGPIDEAIIPADLKNVRVREPVTSRLETQASGEGLLSIALSFSSEGVSADVEALRAAMEAKRRWVKLTDGSVASFSGRVADLASATTNRLGPDGTGELHNHALGEIRMWTQLADEVSADETVTAWTTQLRALEVKPKPEPVRGLTATLRSYQEIGLAWLQFLTKLKAGGILADDMGLGKTVQALALLAWRRERDGPAPSLVVAPTSVAPNWIREAHRFVPELKTLLLHGASRHSRRDDVPSSDIIVTTYSLLRRDIQSLKSVPFRYVILDEAQHIKNHAAATTAAARSLSAESRLALTGTPLENRLLELWSIVDFVNPGMLGNWREFSRRWERPVTQAIEEPAQDPDPKSPSRALPPGNAEAQSLRARIRPFLLRRTKAEVERDLPAKIESDVVVELTPAQKRAYAALAKATREDLGKRLKSDGLDKNRMVILTALLRLRQMACDPRLVDSKYSAQDSAKLEALRELVAEVIASGRRALVFSQFVQLLTLVREELDGQKIDYAYLDGRTRNREMEIERFINGSMPVFLLSLRAGGTGINLAAADVVIHLDPWWNPAVEDQATDRVHRIGQKKTVSVYRIVAAGTIEEAILRLKERKRALAQSVIGNTTEGLPPGLTEEDIADLLGG